MKIKEKSCWIVSVILLVMYCFTRADMFGSAGIIFALLPVVFEDDGGEI